MVEHRFCHLAELEWENFVMYVECNSLEYVSLTFFPTKYFLKLYLIYL